MKIIKSSFVPANVSNQKTKVFPQVLKWEGLDGDDSNLTVLFTSEAYGIALTRTKGEVTGKIEKWVPASNDSWRALNTNETVTVTFGS